MQYRASEQIVNRVIAYLQGKETKNKGLIWHWQGIGKTLTMIFAANKLYRHPHPRKPNHILHRRPRRTPRTTIPRIHSPRHNQTRNHRQHTRIKTNPKTRRKPRKTRHLHNPNPQIPPRRTKRTPKRT